MTECTFCEKKARYHSNKEHGIYYCDECMDEELSPWISVKDNPPKSHKLFTYFLVTDGKDISIAEPWDYEAVNLEWRDKNSYECENITHWMPLPELPK